MSDAKAIPDNIDALESTDQFKALDDKYTIPQLQRKLRDNKVSFLSADNKPDLIWRWLDSQNAFEVNDNAEDKDDTKQDQGRDPIDSDSGDAATSDTVNTDSNDGSDSDTNNTTESVDTTNQKGDDNATNDDGKENAQPVATNEPIDSNGDADKTESQPASVEDDSEAVDEREYIEVKSTAAFNMLEPATSTLVKAGKTTKVYISGHATKDQVLRNIEQYNDTRGKCLTVTN